MGEAVSSLDGLCMAPWGMSSLLFALWVLHFNSWDRCSLVVRVSSRLPSGSSSPLEAKCLLSRCDVLGDTSRVVPGESASILAGSPSVIWCSGPFS